MSHLTLQCSRCANPPLPGREVCMDCLAEQTILVALQNAWREVWK
jgi:hypothetical protein